LFRGGARVEKYVAMAIFQAALASAPVIPTTRRPFAAGFFQATTAEARASASTTGGRIDFSPNQPLTIAANASFDAAGERCKQQLARPPVRPGGRGVREISLDDRCNKFWRGCWETRGFIGIAARSADTSSMVAGVAWTFAVAAARAAGACRSTGGSEGRIAFNAFPGAIAASFSMMTRRSVFLASSGGSLPAAAAANAMRTRDGHDTYLRSLARNGGPACCNKTSGARNSAAGDHATTPSTTARHSTVRRGGMLRMFRPSLPSRARAAICSKTAFVISMVAGAGVA
jgi:hypothetical protein